MFEVRYLDIALPSRWPGYQIKKGNHHIHSGLNLLRNGQFNEGFYQLRAGLARAPSNRDGRLALAQLYAISKRPDLAQSTLLQGLEYHQGDPEYVARVLGFLLSKSEDQMTVTLCDQLLRKPDTNQNLVEIEALSAAMACFYRGNYDRAENYLSHYKLDHTQAGRLLIAQLEWERGYRDLALLLLRDLNHEFPGDEEVYAKYSEYLSDVGQTEEIRHLAVIYQIAHPDSPRSHLDQLGSELQEKNPTDFRKAAQGVLAEFMDDPVGLLAIGDFAATHGLVDLIRDIQGLFQQHEWEGTMAVRLMGIEALLVSKRYVEALLDIQVFLKEPGLETQLLNVATGLQAIAQYGVGDPVTAYTSLTALVAQPNLRTESLLAIANRLIVMEYPAPARLVLTKAMELNPQNQAVLSRLIEMDIEAKNTTSLMANVPRLLTMRKPSPALLADVHHLLRSDAYMFLPQRNQLLDSVAGAMSRH
ncbi:MAG: tetratricopeptide repeat protein [Cephaloticoccus sp.]|nr:tetratricopeptide repeat protein [Cephaloticoccus sp.]MCF7761016.1 tetratricopeptide repeat protein [Cephaloticoccus sp.]